MPEHQNASLWTRSGVRDEGGESVWVVGDGLGELWEP